MSKNDLLSLTAGVVAAYVQGNTLSAADLIALIPSVHSTLTSLTAEPAELPSVPVDTVSPARVRKSITPDALISFIDGKSYKTLKRHLRTHGLTPLSYREKYGLPSDYPMVSPNYSVTRSNMAKSMGLGLGGIKTDT